MLSSRGAPGEEEHEIMESIRLSHTQSDYTPNVRHCLYGLDADLIMLGLLTHDPYFCLLREEVKFAAFEGTLDAILSDHRAYETHQWLLCSATRGVQGGRLGHAFAQAADEAIDLDARRVFAALVAPYSRSISFGPARD